MMQAYRTEGNYRSAARLSPAELRAAMANREILQATALAFDTQRQLRFEIGGVRAVMPFAQCTDHRIGLTVHNLSKIMDGNLDEVIDALATREQAEKLQKLNEQG